MPKGIYKRKPKVNPEKIKQLIATGLGPTDIARHQHVHPVTVWRFLKQHNLQTKDIAYYKSNRSDLLAAFQCDDLELHKRLVKSYLEADKQTIAAMPHSAKIGLIGVLNNSFGTKYDKERLEQGLSTQNICYADAVKQREQLLAERRDIEGAAVSCG